MKLSASNSLALFNMAETEKKLVQYISNDYYIIVQWIIVQFSPVLFSLSRVWTGRDFTFIVWQYKPFGWLLLAPMALNYGKLAKETPWVAERWDHASKKFCPPPPLQQSATVEEQYGSTIDILIIVKFQQWQ